MEISAPGMASAGCIHMLHVALLGPGGDAKLNAKISAVTFDSGCHHTELPGAACTRCPSPGGDSASKCHQHCQAQAGAITILESNTVGRSIILNI